MWFLESKNIQGTAGIIELGGGGAGMPLLTLFLNHGPQL